MKTQPAEHKIESVVEITKYKKKNKKLKESRGMHRVYSKSLVK